MEITDAIDALEMLGAIPDRNEVMRDLSLLQLKYNLSRVMKDLSHRVGPRKDLSVQFRESVAIERHRTMFQIFLKAAEFTDRIKSALANFRERLK